MQREQTRGKILEAVLLVPKFIAIALAAGIATIAITAAGFVGIFIVVLKKIIGAFEKPSPPPQYHYKPPPSLRAYRRAKFDELIKRIDDMVDRKAREEKDKEIKGSGSIH